MATIGEIAVNMVARTSQLESGLRKGQSLIGSFSSFATSQVAAVGAALGGVFAFGRSFQSLITMGDQLDKMSRRTGIAVEQLSALRQAAQWSDVSMEQLQTALILLQRNLTMRPKGFTDTLKKLGIQIESLTGKSGDVQLQTIADGLMSISDANERVAATTQLFGESGAKLMPLLDGGSKGLRDMQAEAERLGVTMSTTTAQAAAKYSDLMAAMTNRLSALGMSVANIVLPAFNSMLSMFLMLDQTTLKVGIGMIATAAGVIAVAKAAPAIIGAFSTLSKLMSGLIAKKIALLALQGPSGWLIIAGAMATATAAGLGFYAIINDITNQTELAANAMKNVAKETKAANQVLVRHSSLRNAVSDSAAASARRRQEMNIAAGTPIVARSVMGGGVSTTSVVEQIQESNELLKNIELNTRNGLEINEVDL